MAKDEKKVWGEALRLGRTAWGEAVMAWVHVLALRVFVETVLRYGLPLSFVCGLVRVSLGLASPFLRLILPIVISFPRYRALLTDMLEIDDAKAHETRAHLPR